MKLAHCWTQIVNRRPARLHYEMGYFRDRQRAFAGARRRIDDQQVMLGGDLESLLGRRKRFRRDYGLDPGAKPGPVPVDRRALLGIKIGDLGFEPADRGLSS